MLSWKVIDDNLKSGKFRRNKWVNFFEVGDMGEYADFKKALYYLSRINILATFSTFL